MVSYVETYDPNDSAALHEAYSYTAGLSACVLVWACSAPLVLLPHSACGDEAESSHVPYDLPQGECHLVQRCVLPLKQQKHFGNEN